MRLVLRIVNVVIALVTLASAVAVLVSDVIDPGYRAHYRDALWFVAAYVAVQLLMLVEFAHDGRLVPCLAVAKAIAAWCFLASFLAVWPHWRFWTPARYVYQLFEWGEGGKVGLFVLVFLGRGAFNALNAMYFTAPWWRPLRVRRPLLGRIVTMLPIAVTSVCVWAFVELQREEAATFSAEAQQVAEVVYAGLDCETIRTHAGGTTTDIRRQGDRHYQVEIAYDCAGTRVLVRAEDGRLGTAGGARPECCRAPGS